MRKTLPIIGILIALAIVPSVIGALLGTKGTGIFVVDLLLFGPILPIISLSIILWLLDKQPLEASRPAKEIAPAEPVLEEKPAAERNEPETEEAPADEIEEAPVEDKAVEEKSKDVESVCPTCGAVVTLDDEYCPHCGAEFEEEVDEGSSDSDDSDIEDSKKDKEE
jgi:zinc-ribbon domain